MGGYAFLSYSHDRVDAEYARWLASYLAGRGMPVWFDEQIVPGDEWISLIEAKVSGCNAFILVMTPRAKRSRWVAREITCAERLDKPILPLLLEGDVFFQVSEVQYELAERGRAPSKAFEARLKGYIDADPEPVNRADPFTGTLHGHTQAIHSVCWSPDGRRLASVGWDRTVRVWDTSDGANERLPSGHSDTIRSVAWSPDGVHLATGGCDHIAVIHDLQDPTMSRTLPRHSGNVESIAWSPDSRRLATAGADGAVLLWDHHTGRQSGRPWEHPLPVTSVAWSPDGQYVTTGCDDGQIRIFGSGVRFEEPQALSGHREHIRSVAWSSESERLVSVSGDHQLTVWHRSTGQIERAVALSAESVSWAPGRLVAAAGRDGIVRLLDPETGETVATFEGHSDTVWTVAWSPDRRRLASAGNDKTVRIWDVPES